jgi:hypothetical protein
LGEACALAKTATSINEAQVLASANDQDTQVAALQRAQAAFYIGQIYLGTDRRADVARLFRQVVEPPLFDSWEYGSTFWNWEGSASRSDSGDTLPQVTEWVCRHVTHAQRHAMEHRPAHTLPGDADVLRRAQT